MEEDKSAETASEINPSTSEQQPVQSAGTAKPVISKVGSSKGKKLRLIFSAVVLLGAIGFSVWHFMLREKPAQSSNQNGQQQSGQTDETVPLTDPDLVVYAFRDSDSAPYRLYSRPATGGERKEIMALPEGEYITHYAVYGRQLAFGVSSKEQAESIYYSSDSGASFQKIFTGESSESTTAFGDQLTSMVFSTDGKALALGILSPDGDNEVTELLLDEPYETKVLFTETDNAGVFLRGYDRSKQKAAYFTGCYNCDGNVYDELYIRDIGAAKTETLYKSGAGFLYVAVKPDFSQVLVSEGTADPSADGLGDKNKAPYTISTVTIDTKAKTTLTTVAEGKVQGVGYTPTGSPYLFTGIKVIKAGATTSDLFETSGNISWRGNHFVGDDSVVVETGSSDTSDFALNYFKVGEEAPVSILNGDANTVILGVTLK